MNLRSCKKCNSYIDLVSFFKQIISTIFNTIDLFLVSYLFKMKEHVWFKITLIPIKQFTNRTIARTIFSITKNQHNNQFYDWPQIIPMQFVLRLQSVWLATFCKYEIIQIEIPASLHSTPTLMLIQKCNDVT